MSFKVFSPNSHFVKEQHFELKEDAEKYYVEQLWHLMYMAKSHNRKIQMEKDGTHELYRRGTIVNDGPARCCIENFRTDQTGEDGMPLYSIQRLTLK